MGSTKRFLKAGSGAESGEHKAFGEELRNLSSAFRPKRRATSDDSAARRARSAGPPTARAAKKPARFVSWPPAPPATVSLSRNWGVAGSRHYCWFNFVPGSSIHLSRTTCAVHGGLRHSRPHDDSHAGELDSPRISSHGRESSLDLQQIASREFQGRFVRLIHSAGLIAGERSTGLFDVRSGNVGNRLIFGECDQPVNTFGVLR